MKRFVRAVAVAGAFASLMATGASAAIISQGHNYSTTGVFADNAALQAAGYTFSNTPPGITPSGGLDGLQANGDPDNGDGVNDNGIFVDGQPTGETVTYPFTGTIEDGGVYTFTISLFQSSTSFTQADIELLADATIVASQLAITPVNSTAANTNPTTTISLVYMGTAGTAGDTLSFRARAVRAGVNSADLGIDNWSLTSVEVQVPEPGTLILGTIGLCGLAVYRRR